MVPYYVDINPAGPPVCAAVDAKKRTGAFALRKRQSHCGPEHQIPFEEKGGFVYNAVHIKSIQLM
jgi:hypothetical protein